MIEETEDALVFRIEQDLVAERCGDLREALRTHIDGKRRLVVDLNAVNMIDSAGLGVLISAQNSLAASEKRLVLRGVNDNLTEMMKLMRLDRHFQIEG